jgi:hypothetical protein
MPARIGQLRAVLKANRPKEQRRQHQQQRPVQARKGNGIHKGPSGKHSATGGDEPHLVAVPVRGNSVDHHAAVGIVTRQYGQQCAHAHVVAVHDGKANQQHANQQPPDEFESHVIQHGVSFNAWRVAKRWGLSGRT